MRGALIEMIYDKPYFVYQKSLPVRGAWIEIVMGTQEFHAMASLPVRGAWIEISYLVLSVCII